MKKTLAIILTLALVICMMPASAFAADSQEPLGSDVKITLANYTYTYDGTEKEPAVQSVVVDNQILTQGGDYNVTYNSNINAGIAEVVITGIGNYARKVSTQTFTINSLDLSKDITVTMPTEATYNAAKQTPAYSVKVNDSKVELSKSLYKVTWTPNEDFTAAGSYTATFQPETNDSNIINSKTATYTIKEFDLSGLQIAIDSVAQLPKNQSDLVIHYYLNGTEVDAAKKAIIENAFNIISARFSHFCYGRRAAGKNCVGLVHSINVVKTFRSRLCIAHIFKIPDGFALSVHIVWVNSRIFKRFFRKFHHFGSRRAHLRLGEQPRCVKR